MTPKASRIGKLNRRPIFYNGSFTQDAGGGPSFVETERWQAWANIQNRTGNTFAAQATELTNYDYRVEVRFDDRFSALTYMIYEGQVCKCEQVEIDSEGYKEFMILRFSKTDTYVDLS